MEGRIVLILYHTIVLETETFDRLRVKQGYVKGLKRIVANHDALLVSPMTTGGLLVNLRNFGIDGNDSAGKLEQVGEGIEETVLTYYKVAHGTTLIPSVAVTAKYDGRA